MDSDDSETTRPLASDVPFDPHSSSRAKLSLRKLVYALVIVISLAIAVLLEVDRRRTGNHYAYAVQNAERTAAKCDDMLGKRKFWLFGVVEGKERCVQHGRRKSVLERGKGNFTIVAVGDWGRDGMCCQYDVAEEIAIAVENTGAAFVVSTGDNFYETGVTSWKDEQVDRSWRRVYGGRKGLEGVQWKVVLGNHDHRGEVMAQVSLGREDNIWGMPERYWFEDGEDVFVAYLDTTCMYYKREVLDGYFKGKQSVSESYRDEQVGWLRKKIGESKAKWKIVVGHHPFFSSCEHGVGEQVERRQLSTILMPIFKEHKVAMYISGHEHSMEHHEKDGIHFFVSGAGSKISPVLKYEEEMRFALDRQGFMVFSMSADGESIKMQAVDLRGHVVYATVVKRPV